MSQPDPSVGQSGDWYCIVGRVTGMRGPFPGEYPKAEARALLASLPRRERARYKLLKVGIEAPDV